MMMFDGDIMYALTAISYQEMEDLLRHSIKTFELVGADHIFITQKLKKKDRIFITNLSKQDVRKGIEGILAKVKDVKLDYWRTVPREFDEKELLTARIQVEYVDEARVTKVKDLGQAKGIQVEAETHILLG